VSLILREEHRLKVFENRMIIRETEEAIGHWKELRNEGLYNLYPSTNIIRVIKSRTMRWAEHA
jgi:hypothetical protein